ncbi:MAG TPA: tail fiber domain-containing protein, partial [Chitinophagaceae bacterium]|nr:tail fiber domain-containing protein [Chitinophagaceae bacterium]
DGRFKFNIQENIKGLEFIMNLRPVTYQFDTKGFDAEWKNNDSSSDAIFASYDESSSIRRTGFIAQEVEKAAQQSGYNFSGIIKPNTPNGHYGLSYELFVVPLVKAVQEQQQIIVAQTKKLQEQDTQLQTQQEKIEALLRRMEQLENRMKQ